MCVWGGGGGGVVVVIFRVRVAVVHVVLTKKMR